MVGAVYESIIDSKPCTVVILLNHKSKIRSVVAFQSIMIYVLWPMFCLWYHVVWMIEIWHLWPMFTNNELLCSIEGNQGVYVQYTYSVKTVFENTQYPYIELGPALQYVQKVLYF